MNAVHFYNKEWNHHVSLSLVYDEDYESELIEESKEVEELSYEPDKDRIYVCGATIESCIVTEENFFDGSQPGIYLADESFYHNHNLDEWFEKCIEMHTTNGGILMHESKWLKNYLDHIDYAIKYLIPEFEKYGYVYSRESSFNVFECSGIDERQETSSKFIVFEKKGGIQSYDPIVNLTVDCLSCKLVFNWSKVNDDRMFETAYSIDVRSLSPEEFVKSLFENPDLNFKKFYERDLKNPNWREELREVFG